MVNSNTDTENVSISVNEYNELIAAKTEKNKIARELSALIKQNNINRLNFETQAGLNKIINDEKQRQEMYVHLLLESCPDIIFLFDENAKFLLGTESIKKVANVSDVSILNGQDMEDIINRYQPKLFSNEKITLVKQCIINQDIGRVERKIEASIENNKYEINILPFYTKTKEFSGVIILMHDITEISIAKEVAEQASMAKGDFLSRMSHEIRTPMNAIIGMTTIAKDSLDRDRINYCLDKIEEASVHLLGVINDILDISKIEANKFELVFNTFSLKSMLKKIENIVSFNVGAKNQKLIINIEPDVPEIIISDEFRLTQVITNLLSNAVKFTPDCGIITMNVKKQIRDDDAPYLQMEVIDTGIGISEEQQKHLFTSFEQADGGIARKYGGTGLGLTISKRIVEMMGGTIWIESELDKGAKFIFTMKYEVGTQDEIQTPEEKDDKSHDYKGHTILIAEDVEINREIMTVILEETGISIDFAKDGSEVVATFKANPTKYSLILMDIQMPDMDGYEATKAIRSCGVENSQNVPIVAMTANVFKEDIEKCFECGMNDHLGKPINTADLFEKFNKYLKSNKK